MREFIISCLISFGFFSLIAQTPISGIINQYTSVQEVDFCESVLTVSDASNFTDGDKVLLMQMQGATINESNSSSYGAITEWGGAGYYEQAEILAINGNEIVLSYWLTNVYDVSGKVQLVSFPTFDSAEVTDTLRAKAWDGTTGGVLAFEVIGNLILNAPMDVSGLGFHGGFSETISPNNCNWLFPENDYFYDVTDWRGSRKGDGLAILEWAKASGRGAQANGGGGGNDHNAGGGGGGHMAAGGVGGENDEPSTFGCDGLFPGIGGKALTGFEGNRVFFGGGGGAGHSNNDVATDGGNGGGIVLIKAGTVSGSSPSVNAAGDSPGLTEGGDGGGGGGAGGTIWLFVNQVDVDLLLNISGGDGSDVNNQEAERCFGPGGGGAGGMVYSNLIGSSPMLTVLADGGIQGITKNTIASCNGSSLGAMPGGNGMTDANIILPEGVITVTDATIVNQTTNGTVCAGEIIIFEIEAVGLDLEYQWELNDGSGFVALQEGPDILGSQSNMLILENVDVLLSGQLIRCVISSACDGDVISNEIVLEVAEAPVASFSFAINGFEVQFTNESIGDGTYTWDFGDNQSSMDVDPIHIFANGGLYYVNLMLENDCGVSIFGDTILLGELPVPAFSLDNETGCVPLTVQFTDETLSDISTWGWQFPGGDPSSSTEQNPTVVYNNAGTYDVTLGVTNSIGSQSLTYAEVITVVALPEVNFEFVINGLTVSFTNTSQPADSYEWDFGDSSSFSTEENPTHTYTNPGIYDVTLIATNVFCEADTIISVEVVVSGINSLENKGGWKVYPNPIEDLLTIASENYSGTINVALYQVNGTLLFQEEMSFVQSRQLNLSSYSEGVYFLKLIGEEEPVVFKIFLH